MNRLLRFDFFAAAAPYLSWMVILFALGASSVNGYALRTIVSLVLLVVSWYYFKKREPLETGCSHLVNTSLFSRSFYGVIFGVAVAVFWILPEYSSLYRHWCIIGDVPAPSDPQTSPFSPENCGNMMTFVRLFGSAFVIAPAEELFFRSYLYRRLQAADWRNVSVQKFDLSAFLWMVGLFALEHNRIAAAVVAGAVYGLVFMRWGLFSAILAHVVTNLLLAIYVLKTGAWAFW